MRSLRTFLVLPTLLIGLLGLQAAPSVAATSRSISATASSSTPTVGATVTFSGKVSRSSKGTVVHLQRKSGSTWKKVASTRTTSSKGTYRVSVRMPTAAASYGFRAVAPRTRTLRTATSSTRTLDVRRKVTISSAVTPARVEQGQAAAISGTVSPGVAGTTVTVQRVSGSRVTTAGTATVGANGSYSRALPTTTTGTASYRAVTAGRKGYAAATSATRSLTVSAAPAAPTVTTSTLPQGTPGTAYAATLAASGGPGTWSVSAGFLPAGLVLDPVTGVVAGTPAARGASTFDVTFTVSGTGRTASRRLEVDVLALVATESLPDAKVGTPYTARLDRNGTAAGTWSATGLPGGLSIDPVSGRVSGTPSTAGTSSPRITFGPTNPAVAAETRTYSVTVRVAAPVEQPAVTTVSVGSDFACRVTAAADLACWGDNFQGNLGTGPRSLDVRRNTPQPVGPAGVWRSVSAGSNFHTCAVRVDNSLWCWGDNDDGQVGNGRTGTDEESPQRVGADNDWSTVSTGITHSCAVDTSGGLWCWGADHTGQLGQGAPGVKAARPTAVAGTGWRSVSAGTGRTCAVKTDDSLWCWGSGHGGGTPQRVGTDRWASIDARPADAQNGHTCGIRTDATLWCWGANSDGQLGDGTRTAAPTSAPVQVAGSRSWSSVAVAGGAGGAKSTCATTVSGEAWCWGSNDAGQLGDGSGDSLVPRRVDQAAWTSVAAGRSSACGVRRDGATFCWGRGGAGQLGNGFFTPRTTFPVRVAP